MFCYGRKKVIWQGRIFYKSEVEQNIMTFANIYFLQKFTKIFYVLNLSLCASDIKMSGLLSVIQVKRQIFDVFEFCVKIEELYVSPREFC